MNSRMRSGLFILFAACLWIAPVSSDAGRMPPSHNWTVSAGGGTFGLIEWDFGLWARPVTPRWHWKDKRTDVYLYQHSFHVKAPVEIVAGGFGLGLIGLSIGLGGAVNFIRRLRANWKTSNTGRADAESALP